MIEFVAPAIEIANVARHRLATTLIEHEVAHTPKVGARECICPICVGGTMRIVRDDIFYSAICSYGCGHASVLR